MHGVNVAVFEIDCIAATEWVDGGELVFVASRAPCVPDTPLAITGRGARDTVIVCSATEESHGSKGR